ncbi:MAG: type I restriction endonuclease subunit R [Treponema sp.]|nr:type I restriction endonuclease subunit R [Treponema sp.]
MYNIVLESNEATVVAEYIPAYARKQEYQSEAQLEESFIKLLEQEGYERLRVNSEEELIDNLRLQLEKLNNFKFTDNEWKTFFSQSIASSNDGIVEKTRRIQEDYIQVLKRDNGESKNIYLIDKQNIHNNSLQVLNQYVVASYKEGQKNGGRYDNRYDVTILVNGLPMVHCELKRRGVAIREAFNQIKRYNRDSFWAGCGLFEYIQIFVISNGTNTKYYSNTTRESHIKEANTKKGSSRKTSNSFEFTSYWADANNKIINDLDDFAKTFLAKHTILNVLTKYCVFDTNDTLLVMRPYQIAATERILNRILVSSNYHKEGTIDAGGYIWHTTGSGKTLTSFKTAILASNMDCVDKVLFVVDRKDLDYQTMKEYDRFQKDAANSNKSVAVLTKQLEDPSKKIIITTIQKLGIFVKKNKSHPIYNSHIVMIFDECHRSQFGELHKDIVKSFKKFHLFGFTGTPIFQKNAGSNGTGGIRTTDQAFGEKLHTYTIVDAINDHNVLPFRIDYIKTIKMKDGVKDKEVAGIDKEAALSSQKRMEAVVSYIIERFDQKTKRNSNAGYYKFKALQNIAESAQAKDRSAVKEIKQERRLSGFNSIFCVQSIETAIKYYQEFKRQLEANPQSGLKVGMIYSFGANEAEDENGFVDDENSDDTSGLDVVSRDHLESAIKDYNKIFHTDYDTSSDKFQNYYKDVSLRMKNKELDILIVVNMFLTGFDATTMNTLWVDKNLKMHGLIQAYSRTNRILNTVKNFGNIVCFRDLSEQTDEAVALFGDKNAKGTILLRSFDDYYNGFTDEKNKHHKGYTELVNELLTKFPLNDYQQSVAGEKKQKEFVTLFGAILRMRNILTSFDQFEGDSLLNVNDLQDYQSHYIDLHDQMRPGVEAEKENINDDIVFEMELIKQVDINIDYILMLVSKYHDSNCKDTTILVDINKAIGGSIDLRSKKDLIEDFINQINASSDIQKDWAAYIQKKREDELKSITTELKLKPDETKAFIENSFRDGALRTTGTDIDKILPPTSRFGGGNRSQVKKTVVEKLLGFFERYFGM